MPRCALIAAVLAASGCATAGPGTSERPMQLQPSQDAAFGPGTRVEPAHALRAWLDAHRGRLLRVPVQLEHSALGVEGARLGALPVRLDDTALGVSLADRVRTACPGGQPCTAWLEARWEGGDEAVLRVLRFQRTAAPGEAVDAIGLAPQ